MLNFLKYNKKNLPINIVELRNKKNKRKYQNIIFIIYDTNIYKLTIDKKLLI